jgi:hypothetical protein
MARGMADADSTRPARPSLIPGVYNYCDTRCPQCPFNRRCAVYLQQQRLIDGHEGDDTLDDDDGDPRPPPLEVVEAIARIEEHARTMTREEWTRIDEEIEARRAQVSADRLVIAARYYTMTAWRVTQALGPIVEERSDASVIAAVETIAALAGPIASKTYRAVSGAADEDFDRFDLEGDANGSAKVSRLAIAESRRAWQVLMEIGRATADGVPMALVRVLDEIDAGLAQRFPRAMSFVRPGFDTGTTGTTRTTGTTGP